MLLLLEDCYIDWAVLSRCQFWLYINVVCRSVNSSCNFVSSSCSMHSIQLMRNASKSGHRLCAKKMLACFSAFGSWCIRTFQFDLHRLSFVWIRHLETNTELTTRTVGMMAWSLAVQKVLATPPASIQNFDLDQCGLESLSCWISLAYSSACKTVPNQQQCSIFAFPTGLLWRPEHTILDHTTIGYAKTTSSVDWHRKLTECCSMLCKSLHPLHPRLTRCAKLLEDLKDSVNLTVSMEQCSTS